MKSIHILFGAMLLLAQTALAQHEHHHPQQQQADSSSHAPAASSDTIHGEQAGHRLSIHHEVPMSNAFSLNLPMNRNGSGTGWLPDAAPMYGYMIHSKKWMYMIHGNLFLRYTNQDISSKGSRGGAKFDAPNWFMGMGQRRVGNNGLFRFSAMVSLDRITVGGGGYPLLFQSGETWKGQPLVDKQHPHDLFSELSVAYTHAFSQDVDAFIYLGYPGEPAFGPVAFMHRPSSLYNPDAPIGHHWQDATHITFGVATLGVRYKNFKLEGSTFTGREPNEERFGFDKPRFDSWSTRVSYNPTPEWALQVSQAWVKDVHELGPREDVTKTTASVIHAKRLGEKSSINSAAVWGYNKAVQGHHVPQHSALLESALTLHNTAIYGKYEWVEKSTDELLLDEEIFGHGKIFPVNAITLGVNQNLFKIAKTHLALGVQGTWYGVDDKLQTLYGKSPLSFETYIRLYPGLMSSGAGR
jgi:hypothetical protein